MLLAGGILLTKNKKTKEFYIDLQDNRYYNPGEIVRGIFIKSRPFRINKNSINNTYNNNNTYT